MEFQSAHSDLVVLIRSKLDLGYLWNYITCAHIKEGMLYESE